MATLERTATRSLSVAATFAIVLLLLSLLVVPKVVDWTLHRSLILGADPNGRPNDVAKRWIDPQYEIVFRVHTFSVGNAAELERNRSAVPEMIEKGPYAFREIQHKEANFSASGHRVSYRTVRRYYFDPTESCDGCSLEDRVVVPNLVILAVWESVKSDLLRTLAVNMPVKRTKTRAFVNVSVREWLFDGYEDPLMRTLCDLNLCNNASTTIGLLHGRNGTALTEHDVAYEVGTGTDAAEHIGRIFSWNGSETVPETVWYGRSARAVNGTSDGQLFPPRLDRRDLHRFRMFIGRICRSVEMEFQRRLDWEGIEVFEFGPSPALRDTQTQRKLGFCNPKATRYFKDPDVQQSDCAPEGLMEISSCLAMGHGHATPQVFISQPHFRGSPSAIRESLKGIREPTDADSRFGVAADAGVTVFADQLTQINVGMVRGALEPLRNMTNRIMPLIWINETTRFDAATASQLRQLSVIRAVLRAVTFASVLILFGSVLALMAVLVFRRIGRPQKIVDSQWPEKL